MSVCKITSYGGVNELEGDKMLFPIHTEHPKMYVRATRDMTVVKEAKRTPCSDNAEPI